MALNKRTPCVGICSTTYGDLVCRGCKRFAHEVVQWNGYDADQQERIWRRLNGLRDEVVEQRLEVVDAQAFESACEQARLQNLAGAEQIHRLMRVLVRTSKPLEAAGLAVRHAAADALSVLQEIDAEIYARSLAHYERNFKVPV